MSQPYRSGKQHRAREVRGVAFYLLSAGLLFGGWLAATAVIADTPKQFLLPPPGKVLARLFDLLADGTLLRHTGMTLAEMALGLLIGTWCALLLGYGVAHSRWVAYLLEPVIVISQAIPIVALAPLLTVWLGPGIASKVAVCALIVFFPILVNVVAGIEGIDPQLRDLFRMLEASRSQVLLHLELPAALPSLLAGLKVGATLAGMGAVVGEFVGSSRGLGYLIKQGQNLYDLPMMFVAILVLMTIAGLSYGTLAGTEHALLRWRRRGSARRESQA